MARPPRTSAAAAEAKLASSVAAGDLMVGYACSPAGGSTSGSGTSSTTYTSSRGSVLSLKLGLELCIDDEEKTKRLERAKGLAKEFCHGDGNITAQEKWLSEMGVGWVLDLADDPSAGTTSLLRAQPHRNNLTEAWIRALTEITESTHLEYIARGMDYVQLLRFVEATVQKMHPFVDALLAAVDLDASNGPLEKLQALLGVRYALSNASGGIRLCFYWDSVEMDAQPTPSKLLSLLSEKEHRLDEAIWNTMEEARTGSILNDDDEWGIQTLDGSSNISKDTWSLVTYIKYLWDNYSRLNDIVSAAAELCSYVPNRDITSFLLSAQHDKSYLLTTLALEMVSSLEVKLAKRSESFPDHSLRFLFLINNTHFIEQQLLPLFHMKFQIADLTSKIDDYIQKYLQASWAPVMSCLYNDTPRCFQTNWTLPKFDSEFQKTYTAQKLCKVPDPELRTRLRKAIVKEVVPGLTRYLGDHSITSPGVSPQEREEMLLELFEG